jgi:hypothetical protein
MAHSQQKGFDEDSVLMLSNEDKIEKKLSNSSTSKRMA